MPVNMTPNKKRQNSATEPSPATTDPPAIQAQDPTHETKEDREKALADAESKNLWDATEVIDMDKW